MDLSEAFVHEASMSLYIHESTLIQLALETKPIMLVNQNQDSPEVDE